MKNRIKRKYQVLEMVLDLLPFDQMTCLDRITELVQDKCQSSTSSPSDIKIT